MGQNDDLSARTHNYNSAFLSTAKSATFGSHYQLANVKHNQQPKDEDLNNVPKSFSTNFTGKSSYQSDHNCSMFEKSHINENDKGSKQFFDYASTIKLKTECNAKGKLFVDKAVFLERLQKQCNEINIQMAEIVNAINELRLGFSKMNEQSIERDYLISQLQSTFVEIGNTINELQAKCNEKDKQLVDKTVLIDQLQAAHVNKDEQLIKNKDAINELQIKFNDKDKELIGKDALIDQLQASCVENRNTIEKLQAKCNYNDKQLASKTNLVEQVRKDLNKRDKQLDEIQKTINELQMVCKSKKLTEKKTLTNQLQTIHDKDEKQISLKQSTVNKLNALSSSFGRYGRKVDANNSSLISDQKHLLLRRAKAYFELEDYLDARKHLEVALKLDPYYEEAQKLLFTVQKHIHRSS